MYRRSLGPHPINKLPQCGIFFWISSFLLSSLSLCHHLFINSLINIIPLFYWFNSSPPYNITDMANFFLSIIIILSLLSLLVNSFTPPSISTMKKSENMKSTTTAVTLSSCVAQEARSLNLFSTTPLIHSIPLSKLCHPHPVYLKLDLLQPS